MYSGLSYRFGTFDKSQSYKFTTRLTFCPARQKDGNSKTISRPSGVAIGNVTTSAPNSLYWSNVAGNLQLTLTMKIFAKASRMMGNQSKRKYSTHITIPAYTKGFGQDKDGSASKVTRSLCHVQSHARNMDRMETGKMVKIDM